MANFDMAELALKSVCPNNAMKYDDKEMPSIMVFIPKFRLCDVLSTADTSVHPAFRVNGVEIDGFWVGKYQTSHYNGRAYSLPGENPANTAGLDTFVSYNRRQGRQVPEITWRGVAPLPCGATRRGKDPTATTTTARTPAKACTAQSPPARTTTRPGALPLAPACYLEPMTAPWRVFGI